LDRRALDAAVVAHVVAVPAVVAVAPPADGQALPSERPLLEKMAVQWGEGVEKRKTAFSAWRLAQKMVKRKMNWDGKKEQCKLMLCEFGGLAAAKTKFSPEAVAQMVIMAMMMICVPTLNWIPYGSIPGAQAWPVRSGCGGLRR